MQAVLDDFFKSAKDDILPRDIAKSFKDLGQGQGNSQTAAPLLREILGLGTKGKITKANGKAKELLRSFQGWAQ